MACFTIVTFQEVFRPFLDPLKDEAQIVITLITCSSRKYVFICKGLNLKLCWLWGKREGEIFNTTGYFDDIPVIHKNSFTLSVVISHAEEERATFAECFTVYKNCNP